jgi:hypothetical protein
MDVITESQLRDLIQACQPPCVSIFMPTHPESREMRQDPIRLKNLLRQAEEGLIGHGIRATIARDMLEPGRKLLDDPAFWTGPVGSIAIYICEGYQQIWRVPIEIPEEAIVNDRFEIKPLLPLLHGKLFYILSVSLGHARLVECTPNGCHPLPLPEDVALSLKDAVGGEEEHMTPLLRHQGAANVQNTGPGAYHGQSGSEKRGVEEDRDFFLRQLDEGVRRVVRDDRAPWVLVGTDSVVPFFLKVTKHKNVLPEWIEGNADHVSNGSLHDKACELLESRWKEELNALQDRFGAAISHQMGSNRLEDIVPSSVQGRIETLFVAPRNTSWGRFHEPDLRVEIHNERSDGDIDLIDRAAAQTIMNGGRVVVCNPEEIPGNTEIAAIYRY